MDAPFDPARWLASLVEIGGGYALMSGRQLCFAIDGCDATALEGVMAQITGQPDRLEAVKRAIEQHQCQEDA